MESKMSAAKQIDNARRFLTNGNPGAYARAMAGAIRAASGDRVASALRKAIAADGMAHLFDGLNTSAPVAK